MLSLRPFKFSDSVYITSWITSELSFYQWSADCLEGLYPLKAEILDAYYRKEGSTQEYWVMTAVDEHDIPAGQFIMRRVAGDGRIWRLGFILLNPEMRGKGYGKEMVSMAAGYAFLFLHADKVTLGVFSNNPGAKHCYDSVGMVAAGRKDSVIHGETWECIEMELTKEVWKKEFLNKIA